MLPYIVSYLSSLLYIFFQGRKKSKLIFFFCLFPAFFISTLRGYVGTDTHAYNSIISKIIEYDLRLESINIEPIFYITAKLLGFLSPTPHSTLLALTAFYCFLYYKAFSKNFTNRLISCTLIFPLFFFDSAMNGIRYGISFCLIKIAIDFFIQRSFLKFTIFFILSIGFHISSILILIIILTKKLNFRGFFAIAFISTIFLGLSSNHLLEKFNLYSEYESPNSISGLSLVLIGLILSSHSIIFLRKSLFFSWPQIFTSSLFLFCFYYLSLDSYAGLRLMQIVVWTQIILIIYCYPDSTSKNLQKFLFLILSLIFFIIKFRHFYLDNTGYSPFNPFHFFWQLNGAFS